MAENRIKQEVNWRYSSILRQLIEML